MQPTGRARVARRILGVLFTGAGVAHFTHSSFFAGLVPERLATYRREINLGTGVYQTVGGLGFFFPRGRNLARWSALTLLVSTLPAAVGQVRDPERLRALGVPPQVTPVRVVAQVLMIALVWWATRPDTTVTDSPARAEQRAARNSGSCP
jgi:uncharacterized membrane protein